MWLKYKIKPIKTVLLDIKFNFESLRVIKKQKYN